MKQRLPHVEAELAEQIAIIVSREMADPRLGFVTVTRVKAAPDLASARVFVSVFGDEQRQRDVMECLRNASGFIQRHLAKAIRMKRTPHLEFVLDDSIQRAVGISKLIDQALRGEKP